MLRTADAGETVPTFVDTGCGLLGKRVKCQKQNSWRLPTCKCLQHPFKKHNTVVTFNFEDRKVHSPGLYLSFFLLFLRLAEGFVEVQFKLPILGPQKSQTTQMYRGKTSHFIFHVFLNANISFCVRKWSLSISFPWKDACVSLHTCAVCIPRPWIPCCASVCRRQIIDHKAKHKW